MMLSLLHKKIAGFIWLTLAVCCNARANAYAVPMHETRLTSPLTVYIFLATECPLSQNYTLVLNLLHQQYGAKGVAIVGVFPSDEAPPLREFVKRYQVQFRVIRDPDLLLTRQYHASVTPEAFLTDASGQVLYSGKIDDWVISLGKKRLTVTENFLEEAIRASLNGQTVETKHVEPIGCLIELSIHRGHHGK